MLQKMKYAFLIVVSCLLFFQCAEFPSDFNWIESNKIRVLDFIYEPAEAAPGDSVTLLAVFAGDSISPEDIQWSVSYKLSGNSFNLEIVDSIVPLQFDPVDTVFSQNTYTVGIRFQIPANVMKESKMIPEDLMASVPDEYKEYIPPDFAAMSKREFLDTIESYINQPMDPVLAFYMPMITEMLTIKIRLFANVKGKLPVRSDYTVRYNTHFSDVPRVNYNTNPVVKWIGIYKVKGKDLQSFDKSKDSYEFYSLYRSDDDSLSDTIVLDKDYTYFVAAESDNLDSVFSVLSLISPDFNDTLETHFFGWFFQFNDDEIEGVDPYDLMDIAVATAGSQAILYPPKDGRVKTFTLWTQVYDYNLTERYRPDGSTLEEVSGVFSYTSAYLKSVKDNN